MTPEQQVAFVQSQVACLLVELEAMKAANMEREHRGEAIAYGEDAFRELLGRYTVQHNDVLTYFNR